MDQRLRPRAPLQALQWRIRSIDLRHRGLPPSALDGSDCGCGAVPLQPQRRRSGRGRRRSG